MIIKNLIQDNKIIFVNLQDKKRNKPRGEPGQLFNITYFFLFWVRLG